MNKVIYSITVEDIQTVSKEILDRELSSGEIEAIRDSIADNIDWYVAIENSINEKII